MYIYNHKQNKETNEFKNLIYITFLFAAGLISAQQTIQGSVSDETGPLPGVSVLEKGTSNGVVSDFDGNFLSQ